MRWKSWNPHLTWPGHLGRPVHCVTCAHNAAEFVFLLASAFFKPAASTGGTQPGSPLVVLMGSVAAALRA